MILYNEIEPYAADWLTNLAAAGHVAPGRVDRRSIVDLSSGDLDGVTQFHAFAGIGCWSHALRLAGWPDDLEVWTGSCPCQPFSGSASSKKGFDDARHLWPEWFRLIRQCRPHVVLGEQVASPDGLKWFDLVSADLEGEGYAVGTVDTCAASVGAPHIRQRLYFVALTGGPIRLVDTGGDGGGWDGRAVLSPEDGGPEERFGARCVPDELVPANATSGFWRDATWWYCRDGKIRPAQPDAFPLVDGYPGRVGQLRAIGNAIVPPLADVFIKSVIDILTGED